MECNNKVNTNPLKKTLHLLQGDGYFRFPRVKLIHTISQNILKCNSMQLIIVSMKFTSL